MGACNYAVAFPMCGWSSVGVAFLDGFDCFKWLTAQRHRQIYSNWGFRRTWIEVPFDLPQEVNQLTKDLSTSWQRIWVRHRYGSAIRFCVVFGKLEALPCFSDCWFEYFMVSGIFFEFHGNHHAVVNSLVLGTILVLPLGCKSEVPKKLYSKSGCAKITTLGLLPAIAGSRTGPK